MLKERGVHYEPKDDDEDFDEEEGYEAVELGVCLSSQTGRKEKRLKKASQQLFPTRYALEKKGVLDTFERELGFFGHQFLRLLFHLNVGASAVLHFQLLVEGFLVHRLPSFHVHGVIGVIIIHTIIPISHPCALRG